MSQSYFLLVKRKWFKEKKKIKANNLNDFFFPNKLSGSGGCCQKYLNNMISTQRLESKQHEEISKAKQSPLSHA